MIKDFGGWWESFYVDGEYAGRVNRLTPKQIKEYNRYMAEHPDDWVKEFGAAWDNQVVEGHGDDAAFVVIRLASEEMFLKWLFEINPDLTRPDEEQMRRQIQRNNRERDQFFAVLDELSARWENPMSDS